MSLYTFKGKRELCFFTGGRAARQVGRGHHPAAERGAAVAGGRRGVHGGGPLGVLVHVQLVVALPAGGQPLARRPRRPPQAAERGGRTWAAKPAPTRGVPRTATAAAEVAAVEATHGGGRGGGESRGHTNDHAGGVRRRADGPTRGG